MTAGGNGREVTGIEVARQGETGKRLIEKPGGFVGIAQCGNRRTIAMSQNDRNMRREEVEVQKDADRRPV